MDVDTYDRLRSYGDYEDSFAEILNKLMDVADGTRKRSSVVGRKDMLETHFGRLGLGYSNLSEKSQNLDRCY